MTQSKTTTLYLGIALFIIISLVTYILMMDRPAAVTSGEQAGELEPAQSIDVDENESDAPVVSGQPSPVPAGNTAGGGSSEVPTPTPTDPEAADPVMCTADVKECPDGSYVSRSAPDCAFAACPAYQAEEPAPQQPVCTADAQQCPDGSFVSREGPNCEFAACPSLQLQLQAN